MLLKLAQTIIGINIVPARMLSDGKVDGIVIIVITTIFK